MKCRQCGGEMPSKPERGGVFRCPECGWTVRKPALRYPTRSRRLRLSRRRLRLLAIGALAVAAVLCLALLLPGALRPAADADTPAATDAAPEPTQSAAELDSDWVRRAREEEPEALAFVARALEGYATAKETTLEYSLSAHNRYIVHTAEIILPSFNRAAVKQAVEAIEAAVARENPPWELGWRAVFRDTGGSASCEANFGAGYSGYTFTMNGKTYEYAALSDVP